MLKLVIFLEKTLYDLFSLYYQLSQKNIKIGTGKWKKKIQHSEWHWFRKSYPSFRFNEKFKIIMLIIDNPNLKFRQLLH